jgi:hypothetical protein
LQTLNKARSSSKINYCAIFFLALFEGKLHLLLE